MENLHVIVGGRGAVMGFVEKKRAEEHLVKIDEAQSALLNLTEGKSSRVRYHIELMRVDTERIR